MIHSLCLVLSLFTSLAFADSSSSLDAVCVAGQCVQGAFNLSVGATLAGASSSRILLLPDQYTSSNAPQLIRDAIGSASPTPLAGFNVSSSSLPMTVSVESGMLAFSGSHFQTLASSAMPSPPNTSTPAPAIGGAFQAGSIMIGSNVWAALGADIAGPKPADGGVNWRLVMWDSVPDVAQLPSGALRADPSLVDIQFSTCSPPCATGGTCSASGTCVCPAGFVGNSCETCATGYFGPKCYACPAGCGACDDGPTGSGRCLTAPALNTSASCNCLNGICLSSGECQCNVGWGQGSNGTACSACAPGFFMNAAGQCGACQLGCEACASGSGVCTSCKAGFSVNPSDDISCVVTMQLSAATSCPDGAYYNGTGCATCSPLCKTCNGALSTNCIICGAGRFSLNGTCVNVDSNGECQGPSSASVALVANNAKNECDACPSKCTKCGIPSFNVASTFSQVQCSACLPGFVLSQGQCVSQCPSGTFVSPTDNLTCTACDPSCSTCAGSSTYCLACSSSTQHALNGSCTSSCPPGTFTSSGSCLPCHLDCATCSSSGFDQCTSCPWSRPVMQSSGQAGRCLPTCGQTEYFDPVSSSCKACDASCSSCSGPGSSSCLACANSGQVLKAGTCVTAQCTSGTNVVPSLGVCLSDLVTSPSNVSTVSPALHTQLLPWWQILLMALGGASLLLLLLWAWRRFARKKRALETADFAHDMDRKVFWRHRMRAALGWKRGGRGGGQARELMEDAGDMQRDWEMYKLSENVRRSRESVPYSAHHSLSRASSPQKSRSARSIPYSARHSPSRDSSPPRSHSERSTYSSADSVRSARYPQPRQPIRDNSVHRFSGSYYAPSELPDPPFRAERAPSPRPPLPDYSYPSEPRTQWLTPDSTGSSGGRSNNPFRR